MSYSPDPNDAINAGKDKDTKKTPEELKAEEQQQKSDPQITELKGLVDPDEPLEVKGTDNPF